MVASSDLLHGYRELCAAREGYEQAEKFYNGEAGEIFASAKVRRLLSKAGIEELQDLNYAKIPVTSVSSGLIIQGVVAVPPDDDDEQISDTGSVGSDDAKTKSLDRINAKLRRVWKENELDAEHQELLKSTSKLGDGYLFVWPVVEVDDEPEPDEPEGDEIPGLQQVGGVSYVYPLADESPDEEPGADTDRLVVPPTVLGVDIRFNNATVMRVIYDEEDPLRKAFAIKSWTRKENTPQGEIEAVRANLIYDDRVEKWTTDGRLEPENPEAWSKIEDDLPHPYGQVPVFHFRNGRPYGEPEHLNGYGPQQLINKLVASLAAAVDYQLFPQRYLLVDPTKDDPTSNFEDSLHPDDEDEDPEGEDGDSGLDSDPAAVWKLWGKNAGEFNAANPDNFLRPLDRFIKAMAELTETPPHRFMGDGAQFPSGSSQRAADRPRTDKVKDRRSRYQAELSNALEFALQLLGETDDWQVEVQWQPLVVIDDADGWNVVQQKIEAGVPVVVALTETGYPQEQVDEWVKDAEGADLTRRVNLLVQIGTAVQTLGAGIALGATSAEQVQAVITKMLGLTIEGTDLKLPEGEFVDPQQQMQAQQDLAREQQQAQIEAQERQQDKSIGAQERQQELGMQMQREIAQGKLQAVGPGGGGGQPNSTNGRKNGGV